MEKSNIDDCRICGCTDVAVPIRICDLICPVRPTHDAVVESRRANQGVSF